MGRPKTTISTLVGACREAVASFGEHVSTREVFDWIRTTYPDLRFNERTLTTTLSIAKKEVRGQTPAPVTSGDLVAVKSYADKVGGLGKLSEAVLLVGGAVEVAGSFDRLKECLTSISQLLGKSKV